MSNQTQDIQSKLSWKKVLIPVVLGVGVSVYLLYSALQQPYYTEATEQDFTHVWQDSNSNNIVDFSDAQEFLPLFKGQEIPKVVYKEVSAATMIREFEWTNSALMALVFALLMLVLRDFFYMVRLRILTHKKLNWKASFQVIMLWEFASALTPSVVGGSSLAIFILNREGLSVGRSTATVMVTALMDELFYILTVPVVIVLVGMDHLFPDSAAFTILGVNSIKGVFLVGYIFILLLTAGIMIALFLYPRAAKKAILALFRLPILRRWRSSASQWGDELIMSSKELRNEPRSYWLKAFGATLLSWSARYFTLNFIFLAFTGGFDHLLVYGRQLVMWVILLISPTPGSSGVAELAFTEFFSYLLSPAFLAIAAVLWRLLTYMPYLAAGSMVLPAWLRRTGKSRKKAQTPA